MGTNAFYLNELVEIIAENPTQYEIRYEDGFEEVVDKDEVTVFKKGIKKRNPQRQAKNFEKYYGSVERVKLIQNTPCCISGKLPSQNVHTKARGSGGTWEDIIPLSSELHQTLHRIGMLSFQEKYNVDLFAIAKEFSKIKP